MEESSVLPTLYIVTINKSNYCLTAMSRTVGSLLLFHKCFVSDGTYHCVCDRLFSWLIWLCCITSNVTFEHFVISFSSGENSVFTIFTVSWKLLFCKRTQNYKLFVAQVEIKEVCRWGHLVFWNHWKTRLGIRPKVNLIEEMVNFFAEKQLLLYVLR